jgi:hypothetical protein
MAAAGGHKSIVKLLIDNGADAFDENMVGIDESEQYAHLSMHRTE